MSDNTDLSIRLVILDAYTLVRKSLRLLLENQPGLIVVGEAGDSIQGLKVVADQKPDIILLKLNPAGEPGLDVISKLIETWKQARIILMTTTEDLQVCLQAIQEGVLGVVSMLQSPEVLGKAIEKVNAGEVWIERSMVARLLTTTDIIHRSLAVNPEADRIQQLSNREREVVQLISRGLKNQQIANQLCISATTVGHHLTSIYSKLEVSDRLELLIFAHHKGLVTELK
jgi:two-component system, NarL family, nitrate/nitrite response regulator NarL